MSFVADDNELLKQCTKVRKKIRELIGKKLDSKPVWGDKYIGARIKSYGDKVITNFQGKKVPKEDFSYKCLSLIMLDSVIETGKKYYPETLLEEC